MTTEDSDNNKGAFRVVQDAPLSADSLRDILEHMRNNYTVAVNVLELMSVDEAVTKIEALIAAAIQSERQRIADSLPETEDLRLPANFSPHMAYRAAIEAVRAVLIPPMGSSPSAVDAPAQGHEAITDNEEAR